VLVDCLNATHHYLGAALTYLPGTVVCLSQDTVFLEPVHLGETLTAKCRIVEKIDKENYRLATTIRNRNGDSVIDGNATILVDPLPAESDES
jgi:acyl dehydratase